MLQETRLNHGGVQEIKEISVEELDAMSWEQLLAYEKVRGWKDNTWSAPRFNCRIAC
jgi:hypothetical protein